MTNKSSQTTYLLIGLVLVGLTAGIGFTVANQMQTSPPAEQEPSPTAAPDMSGGLEGQLAPDFELTNAAGQKVTLAQYRGKLVFLNFWATWCEPCKEEMPSMERLYQKMQGRPFEILAVSLDNQPESAVPAFFEKTKIKVSFPVLQGDGQGIAKKKYQTTGVPESFIIGADGKVVKHVIGSYEWDSEQIIEYFETLMKES